MSKMRSKSNPYTDVGSVSNQKTAKFGAGAKRSQQVSGDYQ